jgi:polyisoprenoid-binding protein YceI
MARPRSLALYATLAALLAAVPNGSSAQQPPVSLQEYAIDAGHSIVEFSIPFAFTRVKGRFTDWKGVILYDRAKPANSSMTVVIQTNSIDTGWPHRDEHLRTSDFFDVTRYPTIVFQSDRIRDAAPGMIADGTLTMHGAAKPLSLPFTVAAGGPRRSPESGWLMLNATSTARLARADFGITGGSVYNSWFDAARAATMGDTVTIEIEVEAWFADAASQRSAPIEASLTRLKAGGVQAQVDRLRQARDSAQRGRTLAGKQGPPWPAYFTGQLLTVRARVDDGRTDVAGALARAATSLFGTWQSHLAYGYALAAGGDLTGATAALARAKSLYTPPPPSSERFKQDDEDWWQFNQLAVAALERGLTRPAREVARVLAELYPSHSRAVVTLGRALAAAGDSRGARDALATALRLDPNEPRAIEWSRRIRPAGD